MIANRTLMASRTAARLLDWSIGRLRNAPTRSGWLSRWPRLAPILLGATALIGQVAQAAPQQFHGLIELDYGSSLPGAPKHSRYFVDFVLDDSVLDTDNTVFENDLYNANGIRVITTTGVFDRPFLSLKLSIDPSSSATLDLSGLNFELDNPNSNFSRVVDANQPPDPQAPPCDVYTCHNEHITLMARDMTSGLAVHHVWFNLYNSNFYNPIYASRQLLLDTSASGLPFSFADLFLHGPQTLAEFRSHRTPNIAELRDPVLLTGPNGTVASGRFLSLAYVAPAPAPLPLLGLGAALAGSRRLRRRIKAG
jgi:hypothetical protein